MQTHQRLLLFVVGGLALLTGWAAGGALFQATAGLSPLLTFDQYSYTDSGCSSVTDPVGTVFIQGSGSVWEVYNHAKLQSHGGWGVGGTTTQYFWDDANGCSAMDNDAASNANFGGSRYHMRYEVAWTELSGWSSAATPHFDPAGEHCVGPGDFAKGRDNIYSNWVVNGSHVRLSNNFWGNTQPIWKSCRSSYVSGDGYVHYIDLRAP